ASSCNKNTAPRKGAVLMKTMLTQRAGPLGGARWLAAQVVGHVVAAPVDVRHVRPGAREDLGVDLEDTVLGRRDVHLAPAELTLGLVLGADDAVGGDAGLVAAD